MTTAIITMAGFGRRFLDAGYRVPKYRIRAHGRSLFCWSMLSLSQFIRTGTEFVFVVRQADDAGEFIRQEAADLQMSVAGIVQLKEPTDGQATTAVAAKTVLTHEHEPVLIYNIDTFVHPATLRPADVRGDGWIPCFPGQGDAWSFAAIGSDGRVAQVREKVRVSPHATVGLYWFSSFALFEKLYWRRYADPRGLEMGERYVAPVYNELIAEGGSVYIETLPGSAVIPLGIPTDVERFSAMPAPDLAEYS